MSPTLKHTMMRNIKRALLICMTALLFSTTAHAKGNNDNLEKVLDAIIQVESKGNPKAYNKAGNCVGILQITPVLVRQCNIILKRKKSKKRYTYDDRWNVEKSKEMFYIIQNEYNPSHNIEKAARLWNGGINYKRNPSKTNRYWQKVKKNL